MSTKRVFTMGFLSILAATGLFAASNGFGADEQRTSQTEKLVAQAVSGDFESEETLGQTRVDVVENAPLTTVVCKRTVALTRVDIVDTLPLKTESCKPTAGDVSQYTNPIRLSH